MTVGQIVEYLLKLTKVRTKVSEAKHVEDILGIMTEKAKQVVRSVGKKSENVFRKHKEQR